MIHLFYDSDSELNLDLAKEYGIESDENHIKMPYIIQNKTYLCELITEELSEDFFSLVKAGNIPSTAALNPMEYVKILEPHFARGEEMLYVAFSSAMSGTFNNLKIALDELTNKYPTAKFVRFDTLGISLSSGIFVLLAKKMIDEGKSIDEIVTELEALKMRVNASIVADDLMYLKKGGRLTAVKALLGTMLQLKPIIKLTTAGTLIPTTNVAGRNKALMTVIKEIADKATDLDKYPIYVMSGACKEDSDRVVSKIQSLLPNATVIPQFVGPVIGSHCGPGTIGIIYVGPKRPEPIAD